MRTILKERQVTSPAGPVLIASSAPMLGIPIVPFSFNTYWNTYYLAQPWYGRRAYYRSACHRVAIDRETMHPRLGQYA